MIAWEKLRQEEGKGKEENNSWVCNLARWVNKDPSAELVPWEEKPAWERTWGPLDFSVVLEHWNLEVCVASHHHVMWSHEQEQDYLGSMWYRKKKTQNRDLGSPHFRSTTTKVPTHGDKLLTAWKTGKPGNYSEVAWPRVRFCCEQQGIQSVASPKYRFGFLLHKRSLEGGSLPTSKTLSVSCSAVFILDFHIQVHFMVTRLLLQLQPSCSCSSSKKEKEAKVGNFPPC